MDTADSDPAAAAAPAASVRKTLLVALAVCLVCSIVVASAAVLLKPIQVANREYYDHKRNIVEAAGLLRPGMTVERAYKRVEAQMIELASGAEINGFDPKTFDIARASKNPELSVPLARSEDLAQIKRKPKYMPIYRISGEDGELQTLLLPVYGYGMFSQMYGVLALEGDLRTVRSLKFYQHGETPGLGGEVDNPKWRAQWQGKLVFDAQWRARVELVKGAVDQSNPDAQHQIDGLAGATMTTRGVANLLNFWLGEQGYAPYLARLRDERN